MNANAAVNTYRQQQEALERQQQEALERQQQEALERQRKEEEERERLKDFDFIRALYEMVSPGVKR